MNCQLQAMRATLEQCAEYMDSRSDIAGNDDDGRPFPNEEMSLLNEINAALGEDGNPYAPPFCKCCKEMKP